MCLESFGSAQTSLGLNAITSPADRPGQEGCGSVLLGSPPREAERGPLNPDAMYATGREIPTDLPGVLQMLSAFGGLPAAPALRWRTRRAARCFPLTHGAPGPPPVPTLSPSAAPAQRRQRGGDRAGGGGGTGSRVLFGDDFGRWGGGGWGWGWGWRSRQEPGLPAEGKGCSPRPGGMRGRRTTPSSRDGQMDRDTPGMRCSSAPPCKTPQKAVRAPRGRGSGSTPARHSPSLRGQELVVV